MTEAQGISGLTGTPDARGAESLRGDGTPAAALCRRCKFGPTTYAANNAVRCERSLLLSVHSP